MKNAKENGLRWLEQARHDLKVAQSNLEHKFYSDVCFMAEQSAQKSLKAYLFSKGERFVFLYSIRDLLEACKKYNKSFARLLEYGMVLDKYYIPTRYPDALAPPATPYQSYTQKEAREAINYARKILEMVQRFVK
jgi:HEPN domain-containing protein